MSLFLSFWQLRNPSSGKGARDCSNRDMINGLWHIAEPRAGGLTGCRFRKCILQQGGSAKECGVASPSSLWKPLAALAFLQSAKAPPGGIDGSYLPRHKEASFPWTWPWWLARFDGNGKIPTSRFDDIQSRDAAGRLG
jgi:hypothetical protein